MSTDFIRYDLLAQEALRGVVRRVIEDAAKSGLPGEHHFFISFRTQRPGVRLSSRLREKYPDEMTIVLQHQFWDLAVTEHAFEVGLSFGGIPERLLVPFDALSGFFDPSVKFGLRFETDAADSPGTAPAGHAQDLAPPAVPPKGKAPAPAALPRGGPRGAASEPEETRPGQRRRTTPTIVPAPAPPPEPKPDPAAEKADKPGGSAEVVSLDKFRKK